MRKSFKGLLMVLLCLLMTASVIACKNDEGDTDTGSIESVKLLYNGAEISENALTVGLARETVTFTAEIQKTGTISDAITLTSSDTSVATVSGMTATLLKAGTTNITATATADETKTHTVALTITPISATITSITIKKTDGSGIQNNAISVLESAEGYTFKVDVVKTGEASNEITLSSSDEDVAVVDEESISVLGDTTSVSVDFIGTGVTTITATSVFDASKTHSISLTVYNNEPKTINVDGGTAKKGDDGTPASTISDAQTGDEITLAPNDAPSGKEFAGWIVVEGGVTITSNKFILGFLDVSITAVYSDIPNDGLTLGDINAGAYDVSKGANSKLSINYANIGGSSYSSVMVPITYADSANNDRFSLTIQNLADTSSEVRVRLYNNTDTGASDIKLNGDGEVINVSAKSAITRTFAYTQDEVRLIVFFIDSSTYPEVSTTHSGSLIIGGFKFTKYVPPPTVSSITIKNQDNSAITGNALNVYDNVASKTFKVVVAGENNPSEDYAVEEVGTSNRVQSITKNAGGTFTVSFKGTGIGNVVIKVTSNEDNTKTHSITIHIIEEPQERLETIAIKDGGLAIPDATLNVDLSDEDKDITAVVETSEGRDENYTLVSSDESIATVAQVGDSEIWTITFLKAGTVQLVLTATRFAEDNEFTLTVVIRDDVEKELTVVGGNIAIQKQVNGQGEFTPFTSGDNVLVNDVIKLTVSGLEANQTIVAWEIESDVSISITEESGVYTFTVPMNCGNITLSPIVGYIPNNGMTLTLADISNEYTSNQAQFSDITQENTTISYTNLASNSYKTVTLGVSYADAKNKAEMAITFTNNGNTDVMVRLDIVTNEKKVKLPWHGEHDEPVDYTLNDTTGGYNEGNKLTLIANTTQTFIIDYVSEGFNVTGILIFIDSYMNNSTTNSGDIAFSNISFFGESAPVEITSITIKNNDDTAITGDTLTIYDNVASKTFKVVVVGLNNPSGAFSVEEVGTSNRVNSITDNQDGTFTVSFKGTGTADVVIKVTSNEDDTKTHSITIHITPEPQDTITEITIKDGSNNAIPDNILNVNLSSTTSDILPVLTVGEAPSTAFTLISSDISIATVAKVSDSAIWRITLLKSGTIQLTMTATEFASSNTFVLTVVIRDDIAKTLTLSGGAGTTIERQANGEGSFSTISSGGNVYTGDIVKLTAGALADEMEIFGWIVSGDNTSAIALSEQTAGVFTFTVLEGCGNITLNAISAFKQNAGLIIGEINDGNYTATKILDKKLSINYTDIGGSSYSSVMVPITYADSANNNRFSLTIQNLADTTSEVRVRLYGNTDTANPDKLNGDGEVINVSAKSAITKTFAYTQKEVKLIVFFIDSSTYPAVTTKHSGSLIIGGFRFTEVVPSAPNPYGLAFEKTGSVYNVDANGGTAVVTYSETQYNAYTSVLAKIGDASSVAGMNKVSVKIENRENRAIKLRVSVCSGLDGSYNHSILVNNTGDSVSLGALSQQTYELVWTAGTDAFELHFMFDSFWAESGTPNLSVNADIYISEIVFSTYTPPPPSPTVSSITIKNQDNSTISNDTLTIYDSVASKTFKVVVAGENNPSEDYTVEEVGTSNRVNSITDNQDGTFTVSFKGTGTADVVIKVTSNEDNTKTHSITIHITPEPQETLTNVEIKDGSLAIPDAELDINLSTQTKDITAVVETSAGRDENYTLVSSDESIATVAQVGDTEIWTITFLKAGVVNIILTATSFVEDNTFILTIVIRDDVEKTLTVVGSNIAIQKQVNGQGEFSAFASGDNVLACDVIEITVSGLEANQTIATWNLVADDTSLISILDQTGGVYIFTVPMNCGNITLSPIVGYIPNNGMTLTLADISNEYTSNQAKGSNITNAHTTISYADLASNSYKTVTLGVSYADAKNKSEMAITFTNNGDADVMVRLDIVTNEKTYQGDGYTAFYTLNDVTNGYNSGDKLTLIANTTQTFIIDYVSEDFNVTGIILFIDSYMADGSTNSGNITFSNISFFGVALPPPEQQNIGLSILSSHTSYSNALADNTLTVQYWPMGGTWWGFIQLGVDFAESTTYTKLNLTIKNEGVSGQAHQPMHVLIKVYDGADAEIAQWATWSEDRIQPNESRDISIPYTSGKEIKKISFYIDSASTINEEKIGKAIISNFSFSN